MCVCVCVCVCLFGGGVACVRALGYSYFSKPLPLATTAPPTRGRATAAYFNACCRFVYTHTHEQILFQDTFLMFSIHGLSNYSKTAGLCMCAHAYTYVHTHTHRARTHAHSGTRAHTRTHRHTQLILRFRVGGLMFGV